ncbi:MAG: GNAT family N-acetyltransferase [Saprospiraceae bacterium]|nr:GNAT family N-acetyltransferase [Saprospiraceae bacterium]
MNYLEKMSYFNQQTERLNFRKLTREDIPVWTTFFVDNDRLRFLGIDLSKRPETHSTEWIEKQIERYEAEGLGHLAIELKETKEFIGVGGIIPRVLENKNEFEIAYSLLPKFWKNGYATELARQMIKYGSDNIKHERFVSIIDKENLASINVALKNGMKVLFETQYLGMNVEVYGINY